MDDNPYKPPMTPSDGERVPQPPRPSSNEHTLEDPILAYTAHDNVEVHGVVNWLESHGVRAYAVEDHSGVSTFAFGAISQFHKPQVFVNKPDLPSAVELLHQFENDRKKRRDNLENAPPITAECEDCGTVNEFPASQDGTTQNCPKCYAFMDVGSFDWQVDFGDAESEPATADIPVPMDNVDVAIDAASKLDRMGEWRAALATYREIADRWPEHATYATNCIAAVQRKIDAAQ